MRWLVAAALVLSSAAVEAQLSTRLEPGRATFKAPEPRFADPQRREKLAASYDEIDRLFKEYAASAHVPGAAWGIIVDGQLAHAGVTGVRDLPSKSPVTP